MTSWPIVALGEFVRFQPGVGFPLSLQGRSTGLYPLAKVGDISRASRLGQVLLTKADHYVDEADLASLGARPIPQGSVLFAKIGETMRHNHRVIAGCDMLVDNNAIAAIPGPQVTSAYLYHYLRTVNMYEMASTTAVPSVRKSQLERVRMPLPPLDEQRRIADVLDRAEALRAKRRAAIAHLDVLTQSIFLDTFGEPMTNPMGWPVVTLGDLLSSATYGTSRKAGETGALPILRMSNITSTGEVVLSDLKRIDLPPNEMDQHTVRKGDVLFNRTNSADLVGKSAIVRTDEPMAYAGYLVRLRCGPQAAPDYVGSFLNLPSTKLRLRSMCKSIIGMANINAREVQGLSVPAPPRPLQDLYASSITVERRLRDTFYRHLDQLDALFASLQQRAFRGEL